MLREFVNYKIYKDKRIYFIYKMGAVNRVGKDRGEYSVIIFNPKIIRSSQKIPYIAHKDGKRLGFTFAVQITQAKLDESSKNPIYLRRDPIIPAKKYWLYSNKIYWENDELDFTSVKALADAKEAKKQRKIKFIKGPAIAKNKPSPRFISDDIKVAVWRRDGGRCVKCGSNENLEFDHIIPVALGGSSTERNVQLLCERCNREKGADLK